MEERQDGNIIKRDIDEEMRTAYIDYAMSVIVSRALPDVRDGLKPVHRRILYAMHEDGITSDKPYRKCANTVGSVLGRYHPHGDASVYDAMVRMAQDFSMRYMLIDGHGNFGSIDGDGAAAMRYTEARMSKIAEQMLVDIEKNTVDFMPNYDDRLQEPTVLPTKIPTLLVNGSSGIAVGMATNIPPHNLTEVINGIIKIIDDDNVTDEQLMQIIKGPDFPTEGLILGREGIKEAYTTGRGKIIMRAEAEIEEMSGNKQRIVVSSLPYQVNKARLIENIAHLCKEKRIEDLKIFAGIRKAYDKTFKSLSELECRAIFERLAPEYTVVLNETINVCVAEKKTLVTEADLRITGKELEYKTFFLDEYQVGVVNDMGKGHRVILANPGAGKSVLLLSKAFKYASLYKGSNVLLTCYNSNLADSYNFKRSCANFGKDIKLFIMTFHKLVKKIYEECLHSHCASNIATEEEIQKCIDMVKQGKVKLRFKAIFIDEVQIFDPLYLELCYRLLEDDDDRVFLMAGDLNQAVRALSRKGDAPWKRMNGIQLDFTGRVRYIEKNYRNSQEIGEYISHMLQHMNTRLSMLDLINSLEYEYNSFKVGTNPTIALKVRTGVQRTSIKTSVIAAIKEIATTYRISYSDIAVLFPFRKVPYLNYHFLYWLQQGLDEEGISYSMIINEKDGFFVKKKTGDITGVVISTIESSLGLDFKAVILAGLFPYNYVNLNGQVGSEIKTWSAIKNMPEEQQTAVQSQMRAVYTACSRARDVLYVISDLKPVHQWKKLLSKCQIEHLYRSLQRRAVHYQLVFVRETNGIL